MKILCVVKFVPDVDNFNYDFEKNTLLREGIRQILNPDDACAVAFALKLKDMYPQTSVEVITMAPLSIMPNVEDLARLGVDRCIVLSDKGFSGSDTYATSYVLAKYLSNQIFDCIFSGTHAIDGDTSHVPAQIAQRLDLVQLSNIRWVEQSTFDKTSCTVVIEDELFTRTYEVDFPAVLSFTRESGYKLPYVKRENMYMDFSSSIHVLTLEDLSIHPSEVGQEGSLTKVVNTYTKKFTAKDKKIVSTDEEGVEAVFEFLRDKGLIT